MLKLRIQKPLNLQFFKLNSSEEFYIGVNYCSSTQSWKWLSRGEFNGKWGTTHPISSAEKQCAFMKNTGASYNIVNGYCDKPKRFMCQYLPCE